MSRIDRVNEEMRHRISEIIQKDLSDPEIGFVTITRVETTPDLKIAHVYFTTIEEGESFDKTVDGLNRSAGFIRKALGRRIRMKSTPEIQFIYDDVDKEKNRIDEIIEAIHKEEEK
ncbi:MAG: 30S ribosome-binding factor RbfA [Candidatus Omnitrophica bacterium]|nr:30S ribosome-binding factor RbfA [Candidatus Omnitrophota bacterium]